MRKHILFGIIGLIMVMGLPLGCDKAKTDHADPLLHLTIGIAKEPLAALAIIAQHEQFFTSRGLEVTIKPYKGGKQALVDGLLAGDVDLATSADVPIMFNSFKHHNFKILCTIGSSDNEPRIIARRKSGIEKAADLKGKQILTKKGSAVHFFLHVFLIHTGLTTEDIHLTFSKNGSNMATALAKGDIDAFAHREPFISEAQYLLGPEAVVFQKPGIYRKTFNLVGLSKSLVEKPRAISKTIQALAEAEQFMASHPAESLKIVAEFIGTSEANLRPSWQETIFGLSLDQTLLVTLEAQARWAISAGLVNSSTTPNFLEILDVSPLKKIKPQAVGLY